MIDSFENYRNVISLTKTAGRVLMEIYNLQNYEVGIKYDQSPVTTADLASHQILCDGLSKLFPEAFILSEESDLLAVENSRHISSYWLIDPLDGTKEFINRTGEFTINVAYICEGKPIFGLVYLPMQDEAVVALKSKGAYLIDTEGSYHQLQCRSFSLHDANLSVAISKSHLDEKTKAHIEKLNNPELLPLGSAYKFVGVASGKIHYYPRMQHIMQWDLAAGHIIIEEAGGSVVSALDHSPVFYRLDNLYCPTFICSGKII